MSKKILIHSIVFSPDGVSTAYLYNDIALKFLENDYEVVVLTTTPHYNIVPEEIAKQPLKKKWGGLFYLSNFNGIEVIHIPQKKFKSALLRILGFVYWHIISFIFGIFQKGVSIILSPSPPLTIGVINVLIAKLKGAKVIYNVQEIYPDFLINQGSLNSKFIISLLKGIEKFVYNQSDAVVTIDNVFYETILPRFADKNKLHVIPNFVDTSLFKPINKENISLNNNYFNVGNDTLKVMYAGNLGYAQDWETLLTIAEKLRNCKVVFFVIGEGVMKSYLESKIALNGLKNIRVIPYQPRDKMPQLIAFADLHFIFMTKNMEGQGFPSKVYTIMACCKPLLIVSGSGTAIRNFLEPIDCAFITGTSDFNKTCDELVNNIKKSLDSPELLIQMGQNGYQVILDHYSNAAVTSQYVNLVNKTLQHD